MVGISGFRVQFTSLELWLPFCLGRGLRATAVLALGIEKVKGLAYRVKLVRAGFGMLF